MEKYLIYGLVIVLGVMVCLSGFMRPTVRADGGVCDTPGTVVHATLDHPTRSSDYDFHVYLPPCYETDTARDYPVLYLIPGRGGSSISWVGSGVAEVADEAILSGAVPPFLIVSVESPDREPYGETIHTLLVPYIDAHYRTLADRDHRAVAGGSLGGVGAYRLGFAYPNQFASVGMFGSGVVHGEEKRVHEWLAAMPAGQQTRVFLNSGTNDVLMLDRARVMESVLDEYEIARVLVVSEGPHAYGYWLSNFDAYFEWLAQDWGGLDEIMHFGLKY